MKKTTPKLTAEPAEPKVTVVLTMREAWLLRDFAAFASRKKFSTELARVEVARICEQKILRATLVAERRLQARVALAARGKRS